MATSVRRFLLPIASLFQIAGSSLPPIFKWGEPIGERSLALDTALVPAGWAFSIWGIIFLWSVMFAFYAASRREDNAALADKVAVPAIAAFSLNGIWGLYTPFFGLTLISEVIIVLGLLFALTAALTASRFPGVSIVERLLISAPLGLLAGWVTAASFVGGSSVLLGMGVEITNFVMLAILVSATIFAGAVILNRPSMTYVIAVVWALVGVISKNLEGGNQLVLYAAGASIVAVGLITLYSLKTRVTIGAAPLDDGRN